MLRLYCILNSQMLCRETVSPHYVERVRSCISYTSLRHNIWCNTVEVKLLRRSNVYSSHTLGCYTHLDVEIFDQEHELCTALLTRNSAESYLQVMRQLAELVSCFYALLARCCIINNILLIYFFKHFHGCYFKGVGCYIKQSLGRVFP